MRKLTLILLLVFLTTTAFAQESKKVTLDVNDLPENLKEQVQDEAERQKMNQKVAQYGSWVGLGKEVGTAVNGSLEALTSNAIDFSETDLGKATMAIVIFKVVGEDAIRFIIGPFLFILGTTIILISLVKRTRERVLVKGSRLWGNAEYEYTRLDESFKAGYTVTHFIAWAAVIGISCLIMFA